MTVTRINSESTGMPLLIRLDKKVVIDSGEADVFHIVTSFLNRIDSDVNLANISIEVDLDNASRLQSSEAFPKSIWVNAVRKVFEYGARINEVIIVRGLGDRRHVGASTVLDSPLPKFAEDRYVQ